MTAIALAFLLLAFDPHFDAPPTPTPAPTPTPSGRCLVHICLGDDMNRTLTRLGDGVLQHPPPGIFSSYDSYQDMMITEQFSGGVVVTVAVQTINGGKSDFADSYGVKLGDTPDGLQRARGVPDEQTSAAWRYGAVDGPHWLYAMKNGLIKSITVTSLTVVPE